MIKMFLYFTTEHRFYLRSRYLSRLYIGKINPSIQVPYPSMIYNERTIIFWSQCGS